MSRSTSSGAAQRAAKQCCTPRSTDTRPRPHRRAHHHGERTPTVPLSNEQLQVKRTGTVLVATRIRTEGEKPAHYNATRLPAFAFGETRIPYTLSTDNVARSGSLSLERGTPRHRRR